MEIATNVTSEGVLQLFVRDRRIPEVHHYHGEGFYFTHGGCYVYLVDEFGNLIEEDRGQRIFSHSCSTSINDLEDHKVHSRDFSYMGH